MSRKLIAGFRTLLDETCVAWADAGFEQGRDGDSETCEPADREATRAKRKLERAIVDVLLSAYWATVTVRRGFSQPQGIGALNEALKKLEGHARMEGRRFTAGTRTKLRRKG